MIRDPRYHLRHLLAFLALAWVVPSLPAALPPPGDGPLPTLAPMLKQVTPAVVNISVQTQVPVRQNPLLRDPFFRRFFNVPEQAPTRRQQSAGSGVIVDAGKGYVLTNNHVIANADKVIVTLKDGRQIEAELVGTDPETDIALLRVKAPGLLALPMGDSDKLQVGDYVIAIGNPFGLGQTVTSGIVSALGRSGLNIEGYEDFIQTDASINPGNSGGALVNLRGELVGINTAIIGPGGGNVGIGFAVPVRMVSAVMAQLIEHGEVKRGRLGVLIQDVTPALAEALGLDIDGGAIISRIERDSSAESAGLKAGDVIVEVNGRKVRNSSNLRNVVGLVRIGEEVKLTFIRDGERKHVALRVSRPDSGPVAGGGQAVPQLQGAVLRALRQGDPGYGRVEGVLFADVAQGSPAWRHGLRPGDIIVGVNRRRVRSMEELGEAFGQVRRVLALNIVRGNAQLFIVIQ